MPVSSPVLLFFSSFFSFSNPPSVCVCVCVCVCVRARVCVCVCAQLCVTMAVSRAQACKASHLRLGAGHIWAVQAALKLAKLLI